MKVIAEHLSCYVIFVCVFSIAVPYAAASTVTIFSEDFEGAWPNTWAIGSNDSTKWGDNYYRSYGGSWSGFCADNGDDNAHTYPNSLDTWMEKRNLDFTCYSSITLSFRYWINTYAQGDDFMVYLWDEYGTRHILFTSITHTV